MEKIAILNYMSLVKKIQNTSFQRDLFQKGDKIILAVSGGPDSACMLDIFSRLQEKYNLDLIIAHANYGLRGKDSERDEKFVRSLAKKYQLKVKVLKAKIKSKSNLENNLRDIRYDFFEKVRAENNFDWVAVAHNLDDQVETFLMRIIRGAGLQGLSAMQFRNKKVIRPLLDVSREKILEYLKENKIKWKLDKTNLETKFLRNKIRNILIPILEKKFNPSIKKTIFDSVVSIASDYDLILDLAEKACSKFPSLQISKLLELHPSLQRQVLRRAIGRIKASPKNIDASHIEEILKMARSTKNKAQGVVLLGLKISRKGDKLQITRNI